MPKPPLLGEVARRRRDGEVVPLLKKPPGLKVPAAMGFLLQGVLQSLARLEHDALGSSDGDRLAGAGVDALTLCALTHLEGAEAGDGDLLTDRKSTRLNSSHNRESRMPSSA